jgi:hypothetical protein
LTPVSFLYLVACDEVGIEFSNVGNIEFLFDPSDCFHIDTYKKDFDN